jgi:acyl homoserine lactone synthase
MPQGLAHSIFSDRGQQFVQRLQWDLCVTPHGHEFDEYDDEYSAYLIVHRNARHIGSCRVRPTTCTTMLTDHFLNSFPGADHFVNMQKGRVYELTRFCRSPHISVQESNSMLRCLAVMLDEFRDRKGLAGFVAVVFPHVARFLDKIGVRYLIVSKSEISGNAAYLICITHARKVELVSKDQSILIAQPKLVA